MTSIERIARGREEYFGEISFLHKSPSCHSSAYATNEIILARLFLPRIIGASSVHVDIFSEACTETLLTCEAVWCSYSLGYDVYEFTVNKRELSVGLYFCSIRVETLGATYFAHGGHSGVKFDTDPSLTGLVQFSIYNFKHIAPEGIYGGIIYHIFVDRFARGGDTVPKKNAVLVNGEWDNIPEYPEYPGAPLRNVTFYGGTLHGITEKLDYLCSLGISAIYLSPIFESPSNHRYDTADYMKVDGMLGGDEALAELIREAKTRDIKIILDGVFNHTGDDSVYFNRRGNYPSVGAYQSKESPYYSWYDFKDHPDSYTCWWDIEILPRINPDISSCREYFVGKDGVISKWRDMGVYGFRLDVADELSDDFISSIKDCISSNGESVLYGEVWEDASNKIAYDKRKRYYLGDELDGVMNYPLRLGLIDYITLGKTDSLRYALYDVALNAPERIMHSQMNLLGTHDTERILTVLGGAPHMGKPNSELVKVRLDVELRAIAIKRLKAAYTLLATLPGIPTVFYGDEAGLEGYSDPFNRLPYPWGRECEELLSHYRRLGIVRRGCRAYAKGEFRLLYLTEKLFIFSRYYGSSAYVTVYNNSNRPLELKFSATARALITDNSTSETTLAPYTAGIYRTGKDSSIQIIG